jgi:hypothetical protein
MSGRGKSSFADRRRFGSGNSERAYIESAPSVAGWSSLAARRAHNPKVAGSNPAPATTFPVGNWRNRWLDIWEWPEAPYRVKDALGVVCRDHAGEEGMITRMGLGPIFCF